MNEKGLSRAIDQAFPASLIRFSLIAFVTLVCTWAFLPFLPIMLWSIVLAVALYPGIRRNSGDSIPISMRPD